LAVRATRQSHLLHYLALLIPFLLESHNKVVFISVQCDRRSTTKQTYIVSEQDWQQKETCLSKKSTRSCVLNLKTLGWASLSNLANGLHWSCMLNLCSHGLSILCHGTSDCALYVSDSPHSCPGQKNCTHALSRPRWQSYGLRKA